MSDETENPVNEEGEEGAAEAATPATPETGTEAAPDTGDEAAASQDNAEEKAEEEAGAVELAELGEAPDQNDDAEMEVDAGAGTAADLEPVFDVPVTVQAVLGKSQLEVSQLLKLGPGAIIELDRKVGEAIDIYVNDRLVARGEVVLIEEHLGVTMTEIIKGGTS